MPEEKTLFDLSSNGAEFSECGQFRYCLWRIWDKTMPLVLFIGLNPSTANARVDDPTIRRVKGFARGWGFGGAYMMNLMPGVSAYPDLIPHDDFKNGVNHQRLIKGIDTCDQAETLTDPLMRNAFHTQYLDEAVARREKRWS